jgi:hypothetical protein
MSLKKVLITSSLLSGLMIASTGSAFAQTSCCPFSDENLKENIVPMKNVLPKVLELQGYTYSWKKDGKDGRKDIGLLAQEVEKQFPEIVHEKDGYKQVDYQKMVAVLIEAVREQQGQIDALQKKVGS